MPISRRTMVHEAVEMWRQRQDWHKAEKAIVLRIKANCRRVYGMQYRGAVGDTLKEIRDKADDLFSAVTAKNPERRRKPIPPEYEAVMNMVAPLLQARNILLSYRVTKEMGLEKLVSQLPAHEWWCSHRGMDIGGFAGIIGELGHPIEDFATVARMWKRLGLAVIHGERQRKIANNAELAIEHGYSPIRRSVVWTVGQAIIQVNGEYKKVYDERKVYEEEQAAARGLTVRPSAQITAKNKKESISKMHVANRAKRYMEKRIIRELWQQWRREVGAHKFAKA